MMFRLFEFPRMGTFSSLEEGLKKLSRGNTLETGFNLSSSSSDPLKLPLPIEQLTEPGLRPVSHLYKADRSHDRKKLYRY